jgi:hypothetical protein
MAFFHLFRLILLMVFATSAFAESNHFNYLQGNYYGNYYNFHGQNRNYGHQYLQVILRLFLSLNFY